MPNQSQEPSTHAEARNYVTSSIETASLHDSGLQRPQNRKRHAPMRRHNSASAVQRTNNMKTGLTRCFTKPGKPNAKNRHTFLAVCKVLKSSGGEDSRRNSEARVRVIDLPGENDAAPETGRRLKFEEVHGRSAQRINFEKLSTAARTGTKGKKKRRGREYGV